jgi:hypothetical protein
MLSMQSEHIRGLTYGVGAVTFEGSSSKCAWVRDHQMRVASPVTAQPNAPALFLTWLNSEVVPHPKDRTATDGLPSSSATNLVSAGAAAASCWVQEGLRCDDATAAIWQDAL